MRTLIAVVAVMMLAAIVAGCGGQGGDQRQGSKDEQDKEAQDKQVKQDQKQPGDEVVGKDKAGREIKRTGGVVAKVDVPNRRVWIKPDNGESRVFVYRPDKFEIELDGEEAKPEDLEKNQRAALLYLTVRAPKQDVDQDIALSMSAVSTGGEKTD